jgi:hypothetical protein
VRSLRLVKLVWRVQKKADRCEKQSPFLQELKVASRSTGIRLASIIVSCHRPAANSFFQDMHYAEFAEDEVGPALSDFEHSLIDTDGLTECCVTRGHQGIRGGEVESYRAKSRETSKGEQCPPDKFS